MEDCSPHKNNMTGVFVATPYSKPYNAQYWKSFLTALGNKNQNFNSLHHKDIYGFPVAEARNYLLEVYKQSDEDFILWVDSDCSYSGEAVDRLVGHNLPMVCGGMYTRTDVLPKPTIGKYAGRGSDGKEYYQFAETAKEIIEHCWDLGINGVERNAICLPQTDHDLIEKDGCGLHFTLIRRDVIEAIREPYHVMLGKTGAGEDFYFCKKVRQAGFPIYFDLSVHTGHCLNDERDIGIKDMLDITVWLKQADISYENIIPEGLEIG